MENESEPFREELSCISGQSSESTAHTTTSIDMNEYLQVISNNQEVLNSIIASIFEFFKKERLKQLQCPLCCPSSKKET